MKVEVSGTRNGAGELDKDGKLTIPPIEWPRIGGEIDVPDGEGADLVASGMAVEVEKKAEPKPKPEPVVETATADDSTTETTALTTDNGPRRGPGRPRKNS